jgi:hypothetical protein
VFPVGASKCDPETVGYVFELGKVPAKQRTNVFLFDTRLTGNSNAGHENYGKELTAAERKALLAYLKGL